LPFSARKQLCPGLGPRPFRALRLPPGLRLLPWLRLLPGLRLLPWLRLLLALGLAAPGAAAAADPAAPAADRPHETLLDEDFTALDLFDGIRRLRPRIRSIGDTTIAQDFGSAEVDRFESGVRASVVAPLSRALVIRLVGETSGAVFDFRGNEGFLDSGRSTRPGGGARDPFDELLTSRLRLEGRYQLFDDWALVGGAELASRWEAGSQFARGLQPAGLFGVAHLFRERFSIVLGLAVRSGLVGHGARLSPVAQLGWRVTDDIEIETRGMGLNVAARVNAQLTLYLRGGLRSANYRLDDRGARVGRGSLRDRSLPLRLGGRWKITKHWRLRGFAGAVLYQRYAVYDTNGKFFDSTSSRSPAFTGRLDIEYRF